jgi:hypothetical protein
MTTKAVSFHPDCDLVSANYPDYNEPASVQGIADL